MVSVHYDAEVDHIFRNEPTMRATDDRYRGERARLELALRLINHEARTGTIRHLTGLSDDRIRKLYASYFKHQGSAVRRRRGKSPTQIAPLVRTKELRLESSALVSLMTGCGLLDQESCRPLGPNSRLELGHRLCQAQETYLKLVSNPKLSFEASWNLYRNLTVADELGYQCCECCDTWFVFDALALPGRDCPVCEDSVVSH